MGLEEECDIKMPDLKQLLEEKDSEIMRLKTLLKKYVPESELHQMSNYNQSIKTVGTLESPKNSCSQLLKEEVARYSRQLILPDFGVEGQQKLKNASVLIVGAGGLGCPAAIYLAAAGVGTIGVVDYDSVEVSNLHRQILHKEDGVGMPKTLSIVLAVSSLNSSVKCVSHQVLLKSHNVEEVISQYDIIIDATDNVASRYLLNDACVLLKKPLISGSALRFEGQLTVYNFEGGPCYRCLYPSPPPPETVTNCSDGGVLGVVPGTVGCLQALEAIKIATGLRSSFSGKLLLFDGKEGSFRKITLRSRQKTCSICGDNPVISKLIDYDQFCGASPTDKAETLHLLDDCSRLTCQEYKELKEYNSPHLLIDVRPPEEVAICHLPNSVNVPFSKVEDPIEVEKIRNYIQKLDNKNKQVFVICRRGNNSQRAVQLLEPKLADLNVNIRDIKGGIQAWAEEVDTTFPIY
ncbi:ubiquitin-like activating enzyme 4 isoform X1 [Tachypleus tridentatus]|uniref:ubiquitin-like activating enzyme 4 isoform X1 n=1 Tax=Tachypleus tridentatus TaxID=6853 RepID=UPI003FD14439